MEATDNCAENHSHGDEEKEDEEENGFCTSAVTGTNPTFQAIFVVNEEGDGDEPLCVCQACAQACFDDGSYHEVEYIGMGPSYCDCYAMGNCKIYEQSVREAERLGIVIKDQQESKAPQDSPEDFIRKAFDVPMLQTCESDNPLSSLLVEQAQELIKHTKETHWIDETIVEPNDQGYQKPLCLLESLAWSIYKSHRERYKTTLFAHDDEDVCTGGAEWWVQVKEISPNSAPTVEEDENDTLDTPSKPAAASSSIDLHYDKDEALAESFGIGSFPTLSTVTYLTAQPNMAAPTIVFDHTYTQGEDEVMSSMLVSRPRIGKHICFDGRLLHGAPYHPSLLSSNEDNNHQEDPTNKVSFRVTFLVNIWNDRRPASVHVLDDAIREAIISLPQPKGPILEQIALPMTPLTIPKVSFDEEENIPENLRDRIELAFVSNLAEDDDDDEENEGSSMVVVTFPPPLIEDCVLVNFGPGLQAYMDYKYDGSDDEDDVDSTAAQADDESPSKSLIRNSQSDYV